MTTALLYAFLALAPPPQIGTLEMPPRIWGYCLEASLETGVSPYTIAGVMAIESRYDPEAKSGSCYGLMQIQKDTARIYGIDRMDPRQNVIGGARILAHLLKRHRGNLRAAVRAYNGTGNRKYEDEVIKACRQAEKARRGR